MLYKEVLWIMKQTEVKQKLKEVKEKREERKVEITTITIQQKCYQMGHCPES